MQFANATQARVPTRKTACVTSSLIFGPDYGVINLLKPKQDWIIKLFHCRVVGCASVYASYRLYCFKS